MPTNPTKPNEPMVAIMGHYPVDAVAAIDALAKLERSKRSVLLRQAVAEYVTRRAGELRCAA